MIEMKGLLIGESASQADQQAIEDAITGAPHVRSLIHIRTQHIGPDEILVACKVEFDPSLTFEQLADAINGVESGVARQSARRPAHLHRTRHPPPALRRHLTGRFGIEPAGHATTYRCHVPVDVDLLIHGEVVVTMDAGRTVLPGGAVVVDKGRIVEVARLDDALQRYRALDTIGGSDTVVIPGLINAHQHLTGDRLLRSTIPDDLPPGAALREWALPVARCPHRRRRGAVRHAVVDRSRDQRDHVHRRGRHRRPSRTCARRLRPRRCRRHAGDMGMGRRGWATRPADRRRARPPGRSAGSHPRPSFGARLDHAGRSRPDDRRPGRGRQRAGPRLADAADVPPLPQPRRRPRISATHRTPSRSPPGGAGRARRARA